MAAMDDFESLLQRANADEPGALNALFATAYDELLQRAHRRLRDGGRSTVTDTTSLVHASCLRMTGGSRLRAEHRRACVAQASNVMRSVIVDAVRRRWAERRGGDLVRLTPETEVGDGLVAAGEDGGLPMHAAPE